MSASTAILLCFVLTVQDGDSLRVRCEGDSPHSAPVTVRIHAIDAPEHGQAHGGHARQALRDKVHHQQVQLRCVDTDGYGRQVCQVFKPASSESPAQDVGLALVQDGLAWWYRQYAKAQTPEDRQRYEAAQAHARAQGAGLWRDGERAVPPWRWRHDQPR